MISFVVPNLNEEKNLPLFLDSLMKQTRKDFELIVVDGFSSDKSLQILKNYQRFLNIKIVFSTVKNFGYLRNLGQQHAKGKITIQSNSDCYFPPDFVHILFNYYRKHPKTSNITCRVYPLGTSLIAKLAYPAFDLIRFFTSSLPFTLQKYRPSGSCISYRTEVWEKVGGFPEVTVNEDGLFGQRIDELAQKEGRKTMVFLIWIWVGHRVKKFEEWGGIKALLFYFYVLGNHFPMLKPLLAPVERKAGKVFAHET